LSSEKAKVVEAFWRTITKLEGQETLFLSALNSILENGESLYGFSKLPTPKSHAKPSKRKPATPEPTKILTKAAG
jgi:hypothetical protein